MVIANQLIDLSQSLAELSTLVTRYGLNLLWAIVILFVGYVVAGWAAKTVRKQTERVPRLDPTLKPLLASAVRWLILGFTLVSVLDRFGFETTSLIALVGAAGLAVGLALQGTLTNVAAGVMLLSFRPFRVGDVIEVGGTRATVDEIGLFITQMRTLDNVHVVMPNARIWGNEIRNFTTFDTRRNDLVFGIGYHDSMEKGVQIVTEVVQADSRVLTDPEPLVTINQLADSSVNILARYWTLKADFLATQYALIRRVKERFDEEGVSIPFPQRDVHLYTVNQEKSA